MLPSTGRYWMVSCRGYVSIQAQAGTTRRLEEPLDWIIFALELEYFKDYLLRISCSSGSMMHLINWLVVYFKSIKLRSTKFALLDLQVTICGGRVRVRRDDTWTFTSSTNSTSLMVERWRFLVKTPKPFPFPEHHYLYCHNNMVYLS